MPVYSIAGSKFEIGAVAVLRATDFIAADFTAAMGGAKEVGEPETLGSVADPWETEAFTNVTNRRTRKVKTVQPGGTFEITCGADAVDAGQLAMRAAKDAQDNFSFRLTLADKPAVGASPKNSTRSFVGIVTNVEDDPSGKLGKVKFTIEINSNIVVGHASAA